MIQFLLGIFLFFILFLIDGMQLNKLNVVSSFDLFRRKRKTRIFKQSTILKISKIYNLRNNNAEKLLKNWFKKIQYITRKLFFIWNKFGDCIKYIRIFFEFYYIWNIFWMFFLKKFTLISRICRGIERIFV